MQRGEECSEREPVEKTESIRGQVTRKVGWIRPCIRVDSGLSAYAGGP
jgi:hypothetical protein